MKKLFIRIFIFIFLLPLNIVQADTLALESILQSSLQHYPRINSELERKSAKEAELLEAQGAFDSKVKQDSLFWASGFYDGAQVDTKVIKPLQSMNARVAGGYRISDGSFPIYQDEFITQSGGEFNLEFWFSLLRNRDIDSRRVNVRNRVLSLEEAEFKVLLTKMKVLLDATHAYWNWLGHGQRLNIYQSLLKLAEERQTALVEKNRLGEVADIQLIENERNILTRKSLVRRSIQLFENAATNLSLYYRDSGGLPKLIDNKQLPEVFPQVDNSVLAQVNYDFSMSANHQPGLAVIDQQLKQQENLEQLAENSLLPQIDVGVKASRDIGSGSRTLDENDLQFQLSLEVPLGTRTQRGKLSKIRAKQSELRFEKQLLKDQIDAEIRKLVEIINANTTFIDLTSEEVDLALRLEEAEKIRYSAGESDFFLINLREQQSADAEIRQLQALENYFMSIANYYAATAQLDKFGINH